MRGTDQSWVELRHQVADLTGNERDERAASASEVPQATPGYSFRHARCEELGRVARSNLSEKVPLSELDLGLIKTALAREFAGLGLENGADKLAGDCRAVVELGAVLDP